jgi:RimJ/RimL family protein N-acetyltransferase
LDVVAITVVAPAINPIAKRNFAMNTAGLRWNNSGGRFRRVDLQPTLAGPHITLRPLAARDFDELLAAASDPLVWAQHPDPGRGTREGFPPFFDDALKSKGCLVAIDAARRSVIGWSRYSNYAPGERITIGYTFLARSHWGGAANAEMKRLMLRHAFTEVQEVLFTVAERNLRSRRAVQKLGAELAGAEEASRWGQIHVIYRLTPELWARVPCRGTGRSRCSDHRLFCESKPGFSPAHADQCARGQL